MSVRGGSVIVTPPSPRLVPGTPSPVINVSRTGLITPRSPVSIVGRPLTTPAPLSPRIAATTTRPPLIQLRPTTPVISPVGRPVTVTPRVSPIITPPTRVVTPRTFVTPRVSPIITTPTRVVTPRVVTPVITQTPRIITPTAPVVISPRSTVVSPGPLGQIPGFGSPRAPSLVTPVITPGISPPIVSTPTAREKTIEEKLGEKGYVVTDKVFVRTNEGMYPKYMKVKNNLGQTMFVELDLEGDVVYQGENQTMIVSKEASMVPLSKQIGTFDCAMMGGACGVAFDCEGEICTLTKSVDSPSQPTRLVLTTASSPQEKRLTLTGSPTAYPVVRYSDVMSNQMATAASVEKSTKAIRNAGYQECMENWREYQRATDQLNVAAREFIRMSDGAMRGLARDLRTLNSYRTAYLSAPMTTSADQEKFKSVVSNIDDRQERLIALFATCQIVPTATEALKVQTEAIQQSVKSLKDTFQDLGKVVSKTV